MESEKKTNWWGVVGIVTLLIFGVSALDNSSIVQEANVVSAPQTVQPYSTNVPSLTEASALNDTVEQVNEKKEVEKPATTGTLSNDNYYTNVDGNTVHAPAYSSDGDIPAGASAQCRDGSYSFSQHRSGTCSRHGGVARWY